MKINIKKGNKIIMRWGYTREAFFIGTFKDMKNHLKKTDKLKNITDEDEYFEKLEEINKKDKHIDLRR